MGGVLVPCVASSITETQDPSEGPGAGVMRGRPSPPRPPRGGGVGPRRHSRGSRAPPRHWRSARRRTDRRYEEFGQKRADEVSPAPVASTASPCADTGARGARRSPTRPAAHLHHHDPRAERQGRSRRRFGSRGRSARWRRRGRQHDVGRRASPLQIARARRSGQRLGAKIRVVRDEHAWRLAISIAARPRRGGGGDRLADPGDVQHAGAGDVSTGTSSSSKRLAAEPARR